MDFRTKVEPVTLVTSSSVTDIDFEELPRLGPALEPGDLGTFGGYRVLELLGYGGMGAVYRAIDPALGRTVALKVMLPALAATPNGARRFLREARAAAAVRHDNVVTIYQVGEDDGVPFLAMDYLQGSNLSARCKEGPLPLTEAVRIGREIAAGLAAAHAVGVIHRDVKPENIWLEAGTGRVKLLDFGLARRLDDAQLSRHGMTIGTPAYMSPEQAEGQPTDHRTDLFALGIVLYRLVGGRLPFPGVKVSEVVAALRAGNPTDIGELNPAAPPLLADLIHRLLAKEPDDRPASAEQVAAELADIEVRVFGKPKPSNRPDSVPAVWTQLHEPLPGGRARQLSRREQYRLLGWAVALLIATWFTFVYLRAEHASNPDAPADPPATKTASENQPPPPAPAPH